MRFIQETQNERENHELWQSKARARAAPLITCTRTYTKQLFLKYVFTRKNSNNNIQQISEPVSYPKRQKFDICSEELVANEKFNFAKFYNFNDFNFIILKQKSYVRNSF